MSNENEEHTLIKIFNFLEGKLNIKLEWPIPNMTKMMCNYCSEEIIVAIIMSQSNTVHIIPVSTQH